MTRSLVAFFVLLTTLPSAFAQGSRADGGVPPAEAVVARNGRVVAQEARAARIGVEFLRQGGNAVDAAVAVGFALAVT
jgi:gamma-glutamyltranspeptidase/glutathione hydrolase